MGFKQTDRQPSAIRDYGSSLIDELAAQFDEARIPDSRNGASAKLSEASDQSDDQRAHLPPILKSGTQQGVQAAQQRSPLSWFGVMVSQDLRTAQSDFRTALLAACELAKAQRQMISRCELYGERYRVARSDAEQTVGAP